MMARIVFPRLFWFGSKEFSMRYLLVQKRSYVKPPNGMAQRQRRDWRDSCSIMHHFWQTAPVSSGRAAVRLEPVLGGNEYIMV
jgi:hypothetical protein